MFNGVTDYKIQESMHIICDPNTKINTTYTSQGAQVTSAKSLKDHIEDGLYEANRKRNCRMQKNLSNYIQVVEQVGQLS